MQLRASRELAERSQCALMVKHERLVGEAGTTYLGLGGGEVVGEELDVVGIRGQVALGRASVAERGCIVTMTRIGVI